MKLSVLERLVVLSVLPKEGNFATLKILRDLANSLSFTVEEYERFGLKVIDGKQTWTNDEEVDIEINKVAHKIIVEALEVLDAAKQLTNEHFSCYEKFCGC